MSKKLTILKRDKRRIIDPRWSYRSSKEDDNYSVSTSNSHGTFINSAEYASYMEWKQSKEEASAMSQVVEEVEDLRRQLEELKEERRSMMAISTPTAPMSAQDRVILRKEIVRLMDLYPSELQLDPNKTWKQQCNKIRKIILPRLKKEISIGIPFSFSAAEDIIRVRLKSKRYSQATALDAMKSHAEKRRHHRNQRRSDKRERRARVIANMKEYNSSEIAEYSESDIYNITQYNCFHSPEITDHEGESDEKGKRPIKVCQLNWRSDELTDLLQKRIDPHGKAASNKRELQRVRVNSDELVEEEVPAEASEWMVARNGDDIDKEDEDNVDEIEDESAESDDVDEENVELKRSKKKKSCLQHDLRKSKH